MQQRIIPPILQGRDVTFQGKSGTRKTSALAISILQKVDPELRKSQALVLAPTRPAAQTFQKVVIALGEFSNIKVHAYISGTRISDNE
ncbi:hypothetical protein CDD83_5173 [Cordyceps sp. RAO-2017]|nr:hypothetical protein CDD83_5173 [Cordyceps sp. RAO-2017]